MVENARDFIGTRSFNTIGSWLAAVAGLVAAASGISIWLASGTINARDIQVLQRERVEDQQRFENERTQDQQSQQQRDQMIMSLLAKMSDKIDQGPRADQVTEISKHLSAIDGRLDTDERTLSRDEKDIQHAQDGVDAINRASDARLGHVR